MSLTDREAYQFGLLPLVIWREARNQPLEAMIGVAWTIRNRVNKPGWWGSDWPSVILRKWQFSSFNWNDPNYQKFPIGNEPEWELCLRAAADVFTNSVSDLTEGATHYYDKSLDATPPNWAVDGSMVRTVSIGAFRFFRMK